MSERRAMVCPICGPVLGELEPTMAYRCAWRYRVETERIRLVGGGEQERGSIVITRPGCNERIYLCEACGLRELRGCWPMAPGWLHCRTCGLERELRPAEIAAQKADAGRAAAHAKNLAPLPIAAPAFVPPPMPAIRKGTQIPVGPEPARYRPAKGAR